LIGAGIVGKTLKMLYILYLIAGLEFTVLFWYLISRKPKTKISKPNYSAHVDYLLGL